MMENILILNTQTTKLSTKDRLAIRNANVNEDVMVFSVDECIEYSRLQKIITII